MFPQDFTANRYLAVRHQALVRSHLARVRAAEQRAAGGVFKQQVHDDRTQRQTACRSHAAHADATCVLFPLYYTNVQIHYLLSVTDRMKRTQQARRQINTLKHTYRSTSLATIWKHVLLSL